MDFSEDFMNKLICTEIVKENPVKTEVRTKKGIKARQGGKSGDYWVNITFKVSFTKPLVCTRDSVMKPSRLALWCQNSRDCSSA